MKIDRVLFVCNLVNPDKHNLIDGYQAAAISFQKKILSGFKQNGVSVDILSEPLIPSFSKKYRVLYSKGYKVENDNHTFCFCVGFLNLFPLKNIFINLAFKKIIKKWIKKYKGSNCAIVSYSPRFQYANACKFASKRLIKNCLIVPDLPEFAGISKMSNPFYRALKKVDVYTFYRTSKSIGNYVFFSENMKERFYNSINFTTVECIVEENHWLDSIPENNSEKRIAYTGGIEIEYGIKLLLDAFCLIDKKNYHLDICGSGNAEELVKKYQLINKNIHYYGLVSKEFALSIQKNATVLVNPRPECSFTRYSFPSKNAEYVMSKKPVLCFKLEGIPDEFDPYFHYFRGNSPRAMSDDIMGICELAQSSRKEMAQSAFDFFVKTKNPRVQTNKILNLLVDENEQ